MLVEKRLLNTKEAAKFLNVGQSTLEQARLNGRLSIPFVKLGKLVRYKLEDLEAYVAGLSTYNNTSQITKEGGK
jgi:excisionase family DNA binding protein